MSIEVGRVEMVPLESISVSERAREIMGNLDELESNMKESGLIAPLAMKDLGDGKYQLLAGERRFTVLKRNNVPMVPARIYERDISELEMKMIEKAENFHRKEMEYYELDKLTLEIHKMQQSIHGVKAPGPGHDGWTTSDTGEMLGGVSKASVSMAIKRAELRDALPDVFNGCKTVTDANTLIKKMDEAVVKQAIAKNIEADKDSNKLLSQLSKGFIIKSFFEGVKDLPAGLFHLTEIDPPYAIDLISQKKKDGESQYTLTDYNEISKDIYIDGHPDPAHPWRGLRTMFRECYRVMAEHSWLVCWFAPDPWFEQIHNLLIETGFGTNRLCGIWVKPGGGQSMNPNIRLANSYEMFFYAWKGKPALNKPGRSNVFSYPTVPSQRKVHPTERPIELTDDIYETFAFQGSRVLIPCLGSGKGLISAYNKGMSAIGFELSSGYKDSFLVTVNSMQQIV